MNNHHKNIMLLVVDTQVGVLRNTWESHRVVENITRAVEKAREAGMPVIWVQHSDDELVKDSPDWQLIPPLSPDSEEVRIHKNFHSSFEATTLKEELDRRNIRHIVLCGAATNWCIRATAYGALERGFDLTLLADAHTTETIEFQDGTEIRAEDMVRELNTALSWLSYPKRTIRAETVQEFISNWAMVDLNQ